MYSSKNKTGQCLHYWNARDGVFMEVIEPSANWCFFSESTFASIDVQSYWQNIEMRVIGILSKFS